MMTQRERFLACMSFRAVDRVPLMEMGVWDDTFERWHLEDRLGINKRAIASGRDGVDADLARLMPLVREGAFIPMLART